MANVKISQLPSLSTMTNEAIMPVVAGGVTQQISGANLANFFGGGSGNSITNETSNVEIATANGNVTVTANGTMTWTFDTDGTLTTPGNITVANVVTANTFVSNAFNVVTAGNLSITSQYGLGFTGTILEDNGTLELIAKGGGAVVAGWDSTYGNGLGNIATINFNEVGGEGIVLRTGNRAATEYNWTFDNTGLLTLPNNAATIGTIDGDGFGTGIRTSNASSYYTELNYNDDQYLWLDNSGVYIGTNYASGAHFWTFDKTGNLTTPGAIIGAGSNVELVAGTATTVFDTANNVTFANGAKLNGGTANQFATDNTVVSSLDLRDTAGAGFYTNGSGYTLRSNGTYNWVFDTAGNLSLPGNVSGNTGGYAIGYRDIPQVTFAANATAALTDAGKHYYSTTAGNLALTLPDDSNVAFATGATLNVVVLAAGNVLVNQGTSVTLYMAGSSTTGNRVVGAYGMATVMKVAANTWVINGTGVY